MVSSNVENPVYSVKLTTVVPGRVTGEKKVHELTNMDLVMKLHYLRGVYFFKSDAAQGLTARNFKDPMFSLLDLYHHTSGRIRRSETGRPFIKCNDSGVRIVEAHCNKTIEEFLAMNDYSLHSRLTYNQVLGPDLGFSPLVFVQFTWFKCGGVSVGLSWAHVLGDVFSASTYINLWSQILAGHQPPQYLNIPNAGKSEISLSIPEKPFSVKIVDTVGDHWLTANNCKMETHSFHVTAKQLNHLQSEIDCLSQAAKIKPFEVLSAIMWKSLAKIREDSGPRIVTICRNNSHNRENEIMSNGHKLSMVEADFSVAKADLSELAELIAEGMVDEKSMIEEMVESDNGKSDFIMYGANVTFVNLEEAKIYGLQLKGQKPVFANYTIGGVGDEGVVLVLPGPENGKEESGGGRTVTVILPVNQLAVLKNKLKKEWTIV